MADDASVQTLKILSSHIHTAPTVSRGGPIDFLISLEQYIFIHWYIYTHYTMLYINTKTHIIIKYYVTMTQWIHQSEFNLFTSNIEINAFFVLLRKVSQLPVPQRISILNSVSYLTYFMEPSFSAQWAATLRGYF